MRVALQKRGDLAGGYFARCLSGALLLTLAVAGCQDPVRKPRAEATEAESATAAVQVPPPAPAAPAEVVPVLTEEAFQAEAPSSLCAPLKAAGCALDIVGGVVATDAVPVPVKRDGTSTLVGWAADVAAGATPPVIVLEIAGSMRKFYAPASRITKRPDVAAAAKAPALINAGFDLLTSFRNVDPGEYVVNIIQVTASGHGLTCETHRKIRVE